MECGTSPLHPSRDHYGAMTFCRRTRPLIRMGVGHASHLGIVGSLGHRDDGDDADVLGCGDSRHRGSNSVDGEPRQGITPKRPCARHPSAALREGRYQQGGIRGEETGPLVIDPASGDRPNRRLLPACGCHSRGPAPGDGGPRRLPALSLSRRAAPMWPPLTVPSVSEAST